MFGKFKKKKRRVALDQTDTRKRRTQSFLFLCLLILPVFLYLFYALSGFFNIEPDVHHLRAQLVWCLTHPISVNNHKSLTMVFLGFILWGLFTYSYYVKIDKNLMHGQEYGTAKWGNIKAFNRKYGDGKDKSANKILSENIRFKYDSSTLRNNNIFVVGGSGAGKTSFFLTPNLLNLHGCNIYTDPKGTLVEELGPFLKRQKDTEVYTINMCEMEKSMHINPFLFIRKKSDITKLIQNLIQSTNTANIKNSSADPFWERAEKMFLESLFLYVWMECPKAVWNDNTGEVRTLESNLASVLYLIEEAQFTDDDTPPALDGRMAKLEKKKPGHPAVKAYQKYRGGPDETVRSVLMTVNARMQPFDNEEVLDIFSSNDIPLDEVGVGKDGDGKTKINIFIVIPDDDDTYNFVPGIVYTLLFQQLYYRARFFGGKLPMDVGLWMDEFANTKMPSNFDKILATCRSRGVYCVPMLQSLAQIKTLFADGAWEGLVGNCDTFLYLGGNEESTFEYISKLLGKWTIDKKTSGESRGSSGSTSENYDVVGRELMNEYEVRLLPNDECILFVRGEEPLRDKKWFPWEHQEYLDARKCAEEKEDKKDDEKKGKEVEGENSNCKFINETSLNYLKKQAEKSENIQINSIDPFVFMMMNLDDVAENHGFKGSTPNEIAIDLSKLQEIQEREEREREATERQEFFENYENMELLDVVLSKYMNENRQRVIKELLNRENPADEQTILKIVDPRNSEPEMMEKKRAWEELYGAGI